MDGQLKAYRSHPLHTASAALCCAHSQCAHVQAAGGALHVLNGNHETMNVGGRYTYATAGAVQDYERWQRIQRTGAKLRVSRVRVQRAPVLHEGGVTRTTSKRSGVLPCSKMIGL